MLANIKFKAIEDLKNLRANEGEEMDETIEQMRLEHSERIRLMKEMCLQANEEAMFADGLDGSILGIDTKGRVVYSVNKIVETFIERDGMTEEEAREFFDFNVDGAYIGEYTPIYIYEE